MLILAMRWDLFLMFLSITKIANSSIENIFYEHFYSNKMTGGILLSPNWPGKYPQDVRYVYVFMGSENEQVHLNFEHFNIEGLSFSCEKDYLDIYIEVKSYKNRINISNILFHEPVLGRFCGHSLDFIPHNIVSKNNVIILDFFSDKNTQFSYNQDDHMGKLGFKANFSFKYNEMITKYWASSHHSSCFYLIHANGSYTGEISSPTYPGLLPSTLNCIYEFRSESTLARIRLDFIDFNLYQQDEMCPVEFVEIINQPQLDSDSNDADNRLCGIKDNFQFFSSHNRLYLRLVVLAGRNYMMEPHNIDLYKSSLQNIGFKIKFTFSDKYEPLNALYNRQDHIPGTECDIKIQSSDQSEGYIISPGINRASLAPKICNYFFMGIHNTQNMEVVQLNFTYLNLPEMKDFKCQDGYLSIYSVSFEMKYLIKRYRTVIKETKPDQVLCGKNYLKYSYTSRNPVIILKLNFTQPVRKEQQGFKLSYRFLKDFGISGTMVSRGRCHYRYQSEETGYRGLINSPFYTNFYPSNSSCQYDFFAKSNEMIRLIFIVFQTSEDVPAKLTSYHDVHLSCHQDYLTVAEIVKRENGFLQTNKTERYCGTSIPGILVSQQKSLGFTLTFKSNAHKNGPGFLASYQFIKKRKVFSDQCGSNISSTSYYGYIHSPHYPGRYSSDLICEWHLHAVSPKERFILTFTSFQIEGCSNAVLRIYEGFNVKPQSELCGTDSAIPSYFSSSNFIRVRFLTDITSKGARGFQIVWTRVIPRLSNGSCPGFQCLNSGHCISKNLTCNKVFNCGSYVNNSGLPTIDRSDEVQACPVAENYTYLYSGLVIVAVILVIFIVIIIYFIQKNKYLLKRKLRSIEHLDDFVEQNYSSPNISLKKEISIQTPSGSLKIIPKRHFHDSSDNFLFKNHDLINRCRQFSLDLVDTSSKMKRTDNFDSMSEYGLLFREKMQKISIV